MLRLRSILLASLMVLPSLTNATEQVWLKSYDGHGHPFDLKSARGKIVALTFASRHTKDEASEVNDTLAEKVAKGGLEVVCVVDFTDVPDIGRGMAKKQVAEHDRPGQINLVDDKGSLKKAFHVDPKTRVDILVLDANGNLQGRYAGLGQLDAAVQKIDELRAGIEAKR